MYSKQNGEYMARYNAMPHDEIVAKMLSALKNNPIEFIIMKHLFLNRPECIEEALETYHGVR